MPKFLSTKNFGGEIFDNWTYARQIRHTFHRQSFMLYGSYLV